MLFLRCPFCCFGGFVPPKFIAHDVQCNACKSAFRVFSADFPLSELLAQVITNKPEQEDEVETADTLQHRLAFRLLGSEDTMVDDLLDCVSLDDNPLVSCPVTEIDPPEDDNGGFYKPTDSRLLKKLYKQSAPKPKPESNSPAITAVNVIDAILVAYLLAVSVALIAQAIADLSLLFHVVLFLFVAPLAGLAGLLLSCWFRHVPKRKRKPIRKNVADPDWSKLDYRA